MATPVPIELTEFEDSTPYELSPEEIAALRGLLRSSRVTPSLEEPDHFVVNPGGVVGAGEIAGRALSVAPKLEIRRLLFLLGYSLDATRWQEVLRAFKEAPDLLTAIVPGFIRAVRDATSRGLLRGYHPYEEALSTVRGQIDFGALIKVRSGVIPPLDCRFDEYSEDILANQILLAATERLMSLRRLPDPLKTELRITRSLFSRVSRLPAHASAVPSFTYNRLTEHYRPAVELARLILRGFSVEVGGGSKSSRGFFLDTAQMFEDFVVIALREALELSEQSFPQEARGRKLFLDRGQRVKLEPDLSWWTAGQCVFVGDAKYKRTPPSSGVKNPDLYQLLAYTQATGLTRGLLVYAAGEDEEARYSIAGSETELEVRTLDLDQEPARLLEQVGSIAARIRAVASFPVNERVLAAAEPTRVFATQTVQTAS